MEELLFEFRELTVLYLRQRVPCIKYGMIKYLMSFGDLKITKVMFILVEDIPLSFRFHGKVTIGVMIQIKFILHLGFLCLWRFDDLVKSRVKGLI